MQISGNLFAQEEKVLKGRIVDENNGPVAGAIVNVSESSRIALSDKDGYFSLKNVKDADEICASCAGYLPATAFADFENEFRITLQPDADEHMHTTPVPFGRKPKKFVTEATSTVTGEELEKYPITVLQNAFVSTVTGVENYEWASEPGWSESTMFIRGLRTMNINARTPLVIVDNVERDLSFLDAYPIESITVLKDAAACAIYGMRGANGVILVTTKRGQAGKTQIDITQEFGFQTLNAMVENQNSYNTALTRNQVAYLDGLDPVFSDYDIEMYRRVCDGEPLSGMDRYKYFNTNWYDVLYRDVAPQYKTNITINGGNAKARYFVSFSYLRQEAMWNSKWTEYNDSYSTQQVLNRYNLRSNIDIDVNKYLNVSLDLGGRIDNISQPLTGVFDLVTFGATEASPMKPVFCPDGSFFVDADAQNAAVKLAAAGLEKNRRRNLYTTVTATGDLSPLLPGLKARILVSFDSYETFKFTQSADVDAFYYNLMDDVNSVSDYTYTRKRTYSALSNPVPEAREWSYNVNLNGGLEYADTFGKHSINAQAFMRTYQNVVRGQESSNRYLSYNAQATYVYAGKYILSGNLSYMGCDNFAPDDRFGLFSGGSVGWVMSEESWLKNKPGVSLLKLRASYGRAGQAVTGTARYPFQSTYAQGDGYNFGTAQSYTEGSYELQAGNSNNKWELSDMLNVGVDFDLWHKKLYGSLDVFKEWRSNILVTRSTVPSLFGLAIPQDSYGKAETKGVELTLGHRNSIGKFNYHIEGMLSWNTNRITEMDELEPNVPWQRKTGKRIFDQFVADGICDGNVGGWNVFLFKQWASDPDLIPTSHQDAIDHPEKYPYHSAAGSGQPLGTAVFEDLNGDRLIDTNDMTPLGYTMIPEITPSLNVGFEWKGLDARIILTAFLNRSVMCRENMAYSGYSKLPTHEVTKAWGYYTDDPNDPRNINAKYPRPQTTGFNPIDSQFGDYQHNTIWHTNGNYLSLRNIEVGYSLPRTLVAKAGMTRCRFYASGYNLCTWSHLPKGFDPEKPTSYTWWYPKTRTFSVGFQIGF